MRASALTLVAALAPVLVGCATSGASDPDATASTSLEVELAASGPWSDAKGATPWTPPRQEPAVAARTPRPGPRSAPAAPTPPAPAETTRRGSPSTAQAPVLAVPLARGTGEVAAKGAAPVKPLAAVARERFLDHPTEIHADSLTLTLPARLASEARLTGTEVTEPAGGKRVAAGGARLVCRELTLVGERITLKTRADGGEDVQLTARGGVDFVSRQREHVVRHERLRTLLLTNDTVTPLP